MTAPERIIYAPGLHEPESTKDVEYIQRGVDPEHAFESAGLFRFALSQF